MLKPFFMDPFKIAEDKFGKVRAEQIRAEIEELAAELEKLISFPLETDNEP